MIDVALFRALLAALPPTAQLILVGDVDQLPSVGPGAVLADVIASGAATVIRLTEIYRQAAASRIVVNAHSVNAGRLPDLDPPPGEGPARSDFYFVSRDDPAVARDTVVELVAERIPARFGFDPVAGVQVLTPMHRGELGTMALNAALQARLNPARDGVRETRRGDRAFRAGDKVMQVRNDYDKDVFNGDIGVVREVGDDGRLTVELLDGRKATWEAGELDQLVHAYAVSVHKSQGSEYPAVVIPLVTQHYMMLQRNLLYTGITRGKRLVVLVGSRKAIGMAVRNDDTRKRWTWLAERIRGTLPTS
jgi:exodeoxyribonuclease V alpha subunit